MEYLLSCPSVLRIIPNLCSCSVEPRGTTRWLILVRAEHARASAKNLADLHPGGTHIDALGGNRRRGISIGAGSRGHPRHFGQFTQSRIPFLMLIDQFHKFEKVIGAGIGRQRYAISYDLEGPERPSPATRRSARGSLASWSRNSQLIAPWKNANFGFYRRLSKFLRRVRTSRLYRPVALKSGVDMFKMKFFIVLLALVGAASFPVSSYAADAADAMTGIGVGMVEDAIIVPPPPFGGPVVLVRGVTSRTGCCANIRQAPSSTTCPAPCRMACISMACPARRSPRRFRANSCLEFIRWSNRC